MRRRIFSILAGLSLVLYLATGVLWWVSYVLDRWHQGVRLCGDVSIDVYSGRVYLYGGQISHPWVVGSGFWWLSSPPQVVWDHLGVDYCLIPASYGTGSGWSVSAPLFYPQILTAILSALWVLAWWRRRRRRAHLRGCCAKCGYDLRGNPSGKTCPECGAPIPVDLVRQPLT
jgi:hypothetical protein